MHKVMIVGKDKAAIFIKKKWYEHLMPKRVCLKYVDPQFNEIVKLEDLIEKFNSTYSQLETLKFTQIPIPNGAPGSTVEYCLFTFNFVCQGYISRTLCLAKSYAKALSNKEYLAATVVGRALIETVVHFHDLLHRGLKYLDEGKNDEFYHLVASFALKRGKGRYENIQHVKLKRTDIQDAFRSADKHYKITYDEYGTLCEFGHPHPLGTTLGFSDLEKATGAVSFLDDIRHEGAFGRAIISGALLFPIMKDSVQTMLWLLTQINQKWQPSPNLSSLFKDAEIISDAEDIKSA